MAAGAKRSKQHAHKVFIWKKINFFLCLGREERKAIEKCIYDKQGWTMWGKPKAGKVNSNKITERRITSWHWPEKGDQIRSRSRSRSRSWGNKTEIRIMAGSHSRRMQPEVSKLNKSPGRQMSTDRSRRWVWGKISGHRGHFWVIKINYIMNDTGEGGR